MNRIWYHIRHFVFRSTFTAALAFSCTLSLILALCLTRCTPRPDEAEFCILYTTDVYGFVLPYDFTTDRPRPSLANFASLVKEQRGIYGTHLITLDNGNKLTGDIVSFYYNFIDSVHEPLCYRAERLIDYDAMGVGYRDPEIPEFLNPVKHDVLRQPHTICANLINSGTGQPVFSPYAVFDRNGIRIAVLGMMSPGVSEWIPGEIWHDVETQDMIECAQKWVPIIEKHVHPDILIGLFNCNPDYNAGIHDANSYKNPQGGIPAAMEVPGFDLILLGCQKETEVSQFKNKEGNYVPYIVAGETCQNAGMARIRMTKRPDGKYDKRIFTTVVDLEQYEPDPDYCREVQMDQDSLFLWFNEPIGYLKDDIYGNKGLWGPDFYRDLLNTAQLEYSGAQVSMASLNIPHDTIKAGPVTMKTIFKMYPYENQLMNMSMNGEEIRRYLEWGYSLQYEQMHSPNDPMLALLKDPKGHIIYNIEGRPYLRHDPTHFISGGGVRYTVDFTKPAGDRVEIVEWRDGTPFNPRKQYHVVINSFWLQNNGNFISDGMQWDQDDLALHAVPTEPNSIRLVLRNFFMNHDTVRFNYRFEWMPIPTDFWQTAKVREQNTLNPIW